MNNHVRTWAPAGSLVESTFELPILFYRYQQNFISLRNTYVLFLHSHESVNKKLYFLGTSRWTKGRKPHASFRETARAIARAKKNRDKFRTMCVKGSKEFRVILRSFRTTSDCEVILSPWAPSINPPWRNPKIKEVY